VLSDAQGPNHQAVRRVKGPATAAFGRDVRTELKKGAAMFRRSLTLASAVIVALSLIAVAGCSDGDGSLDGTNWKLSGWTLSSLDPADFTITAQFSDGNISGSSGVNTYSGAVKLGPGAAFSAGPLASTEMAGPEDAMRAESAYMTLLGEAKSFKMAAGKLTLYDGGGNESLIFEAASN
jgi:heat shock protein HslJ